MARSIVATVSARVWLDELSFGDALVIGGIAAVLGPIGDLCKSMVKRAAGTKDSRRLFLAHGGMLDRIDAILFDAPGVSAMILSVSFRRTQRESNLRASMCATSAQTRESITRIHWRAHCLTGARGEAMKVSSLIRRDVTSCTIHDNLERVARLMWENDIGCLPVIDDQGHIAGMITDRDACMAAYTQGLPLRAIPVIIAMARRVFACREADEVDAVERVMSEHQIHRMPVIDDQGHPVGIISLRDIARAASAGTVPTREVVATFAAVSAPRRILASAA